MVCLSVTVVIPAQTAEPIEIPFGGVDSGVPRNHVLNDDLDLPWEDAMLRGERGGHCNV